MYTQQTHYFLGANTPDGFYSMYDELIDIMASDTLFIIKGVPGLEKSGFLMKIADKMIDNNLHVELIHCSGNPDSLDAINIPALGVAYVNSTYPHLIEAKYPAVMEQYINLCSLYDSNKIKLRKTEIAELDRECVCLYNRAFNCISAAWGVMREMSGHIIDEDVYGTIHRRAKGIISREVPKAGKTKGKTVKRFLSALTYEGLICRFDTVKSLADKIYVLDNDLSLSHVLLSDIAEAASNAGHDIILCPSPFDPEIIEHIIIPKLSLAFVSSSRYIAYEGDYYRHIRLDAMAEGEKLKSFKTRIRFSKKIAGILIQEAADTLADARVARDKMEAIYNSYLDLDKLNSLAYAHINLLLDKI